MSTWLAYYLMSTIAIGGLAMLVFLIVLLSWLVFSDESPLPDNSWVRLPFGFAIFTAIIATLLYVVDQIT